MEKLRANMIVFAYQVVHANSIITKTRADMKDIVSGFTQYSTVTGQIRQKLAERNQQKNSLRKYTENIEKMLKKSSNNCWLSILAEVK